MTTITETKIAYRMLPAEEWEKLLPIFESQGAAMPNPDVATAAVAEDEQGNIIGMLILQLVFHTEPLWISPEHTGKVSWKHLYGMVEDLLRPSRATAYVFSPDAMVSRMAEIVGMEQLPWKVYRKEVE